MIAAPFCLTRPREVEPAHPNGPQLSLECPIHWPAQGDCEGPLLVPEKAPAVQCPCTLPAGALAGGR